MMIPVAIEFLLLRRVCILIGGDNQFNSRSARVEGGVDHIAHGVIGVSASGESGTSSELINCGGILISITNPASKSL